MPTTTLSCDMLTECLRDVSMIDNRGFVYCETHGMRRRLDTPCRKLRPYELNRLRRGEQVTRY